MYDQKKKKKMKKKIKLKSERQHKFVQQLLTHFTATGCKERRDKI